MRLASLLLACALVGCTYPYPIMVAASGFVIPPRPKNEPLSEKGARVAVVAEAPACAMIGLATGVGGAHDVWQATGDETTKLRAEAMVALRNAVGEHGGTHVVIDASVNYGNVGRWSNVLLRGRAYRC